MNWFIVDLVNDNDPQDTATWTGKADSAFETEKVAEVAYMGYSAMSSRRD